ncbi:MAG: hypothetical protein LH609_14665 [Rudanella sp.]|nr:hypothetical protein [Rudanella sp.]
MPDLHALHRTGGPATHTAIVCIGHWSTRLLMNEPMLPNVDMRGRPYGRIDQRSYRCFTLAGSVLAPRWKDAGMKTLIIVKRSPTKHAVC